MSRIHGNIKGIMAIEGKRKTMRKRILVLANVLLIAGLAGFGGYYFKKYQDITKNPPSSEQAQKEETQKIVEKVSRLYGSLPKDEEPTVAKVQDKEKLKDQPFFDKAEKDDITLIYPNAKLAILYRPSTNQLINVSSVSIQNNKSTVKVVGDTAKRADVQRILKETYANDVTVNGESDSKVAPPAGITVVDLTGQKGDAAKKLAEGLKGQVGNLPEGEDKPAGVDILVIVGA